MPFSREKIATVRMAAASAGTRRRCAELKAVVFGGGAMGSLFGAKIAGLSRVRCAIYSNWEQHVRATINRFGSLSGCVSFYFFGMCMCDTV